MDTIEYWRDLATSYKTTCDQLQAEFDEFHRIGRELETELRTELDQVEAKNNRLTASNASLTRELDATKERADMLQIESTKQIARLEKNLAQVTAERDDMQRYIRELEQTNDDLERAKRNVSAMVEELEKRINDTVERNAILESELDEKEALRECIQRSKEENRDLQQEINVRRLKEQQQQHPNTTIMPMTDATLPPSNTTSTNSPMRRSQTVPGVDHAPSSSTSSFSPSHRISALNIVGDLLRKVGALETKLASCRKYTATNDSTTDAPLAKQAHLSTT